MSRLSCTVRLVRFVCDCRFERGSLCSCPQAEAIGGSSFWESPHRAAPQLMELSTAGTRCRKPCCHPCKVLQDGTLWPTNWLLCLAHAPQDSKSRTIELCTRARPSGVHGMQSRRTCKSKQVPGAAHSTTAVVQLASASTALFPCSPKAGR